jgi:hypothetical protein
MGTHFLGKKRITKLSNKFGIQFICGYENGHYKGYKLYILKDFINSYVLLVTKKNEHKLRRVPINYDYNYPNRIEIDYQNEDVFIREFVV